MVTDPWYQNLDQKYGHAFCIEAGYFPEDKPFDFVYAEHFYLPQNTNVLQFSGAFYPFHDGHWANIVQAIEHIAPSAPSGVVVIHADHNSYRHSKGFFDPDIVAQSLDMSIRSLPKNWTCVVVDENKVPNNCSRNFTRLYGELSQTNRVVFVCGGDRANFALTFIDQGECVVVGRSDHPQSLSTQAQLNSNSRIAFLHRTDNFSSSSIRKKTL